MGECNSLVAPKIYPNLNDQLISFNRTNEIKDYFISEIKERELMSKRLSKYIAYLIILINILLLYLQQVVPFLLHLLQLLLEQIGIAIARFSLLFSMSTGIVKMF